MKVICDKQKLLDAVNIVQKAVPTRTTLPVLEGILIEAGEKLKMTGNDLEIGIECCIEADIREKGSIVVNSRIFGEIIRRLSDSEVLIEVNKDNVVVIECENSYFNINGIASAGYPAIPSIDTENAFWVSQKTLRDMIRQTIFAVSIDENRPILTGSLIECKGKELSMVSIDGFRLALRKCSIEDETGRELPELRVVVPGKTLNEVLKILQPVDDPVEIYTSYNQVQFNIGICKVVSKLLEGEYLNYNGVIPKEYQTKARVNTKSLLSSIERAALVITSEDRKYPVAFNIKDDAFVITANTDVGHVREELKIELEGNDIEIYFNHKYFIEALRVIDNEDIDVFFTNSVGPCTIKPIAGDSFVYMVLPVRR